MGDEDANVRKSAVTVMSEMGQEAAPHANALARRLLDPNVDVWWGTVEALGHMDETAIAALVVQLDDERVELRRIAAEALGQRGEAVAPHAEALAKRLDDP